MKGSNGKVITHQTVTEWLKTNHIEGKYLVSMHKIINTYWSKMMYMPAARFHHSNYRGGLANHTANVMRHALNLSSVYPEVDRDEIVFLAMAHDLGKLDCYMMNGYHVKSTAHMDHIFTTILRLQMIGILLTPEQMKAIVGHHGGWTIDKSLKHNIESILLHTADMLACQDESKIAKLLPEDLIEETNEVSIQSTHLEPKRGSVNSGSTYPKTGIAVPREGISL